MCEGLQRICVVSGAGAAIRFVSNHLRFRWRRTAPVLDKMWRAVQSGGRASFKVASVDDDDLAKIKPLRGVDGSAWIRKGYVVAGATLVALFLVSGLLTHLGYASSPPSVLQYVTGTTFHVDSLLDETTSTSEPELPDGVTSSNATGCSEREAKLKVFMYDLPPQFHYGMMPEFEAGLTWPRNVTSLPKYPGGLYQQHSPEYWLISDLLTSDYPDRSTPCTAFRVRRWQDADVILVPFFASLSYNKFARSELARKKILDVNQKLQVQLVTYLKAQPAWRASGGTDHVVVMHHPNSLEYRREALRRAMYVVADFGRYGADVANMKKDVVAPYKHVIPIFEEDPDSYSSRPTLLFFQGAIVRKQGGIIRKQLYELLHDEPDVVFATGSTTSEGIRTAASGMRLSRFCLHLAGDTPSSNRLFDAVASHCVPLIISDEIELPFEDVLDYSEFCIFVNSSESLKPGFISELLRKMPFEEWRRMHRRLREVKHHFEYQHPTRLGDAVHMTWDAIARKVPGVKLAQNKRRRFKRSEDPLRPKSIW